MPSSSRAPRRPRSRRLVAILASVLVLAVIVAVVAVVTLSPATGLAAALETDDFASCLDREEPDFDVTSLPTMATGEQDDEIEFWSQPTALHCAGVALNEERRIRALSIAFPALDGGADGDVSEQWKPIADYTVWLAESDTPRDIAMLRIAGVIRGLWVAHSVDGNWADGFTNTAVLTDMRARDELPGFDAWLEEQEDAGEEFGEDVDLFTYRGDVLETSGEDVEAAYRDYLDRSRALYEVVR